MNKKLLSIACILALTLVVFVPTAKGTSVQSLGPGKMSYVIATIAGGPQTVDPALAYDTASGELIANVYDTLVFFKGTSSSDFVPWLSDTPIANIMTPGGLQYTFHIRPGVQWQNASFGTVTAADAAYSLQKVLVRDYTGGPAWMLWFPIFGIYVATDFGDLTNPAVATALGNAIASAITHDDVAQTVTINFQTGKAYLPFLGILANTWGCIESEAWAIAHGDWNPAVDKLSDGTWVNARDPATSPLDAPSGPSTTGFMMGSGPYKFDFLNAGIAWSISRNVNFWGGWGTGRSANLGLAITSRGYLDQIVEYFISSYATRLAGFTGVTPIYDNIAVPRASISTVWQQPGIKPQYPLPSQAVDAMFFAYNVSMLSPYIESPTSPTYFGENGIRPDFMSDVHVRRAISYSFNFSQFLAAAYLGEASQVGIPIPPTYQFYNGSSALRYSIDLTKAVQEWQLAWGGQVWANGFYFDTVYNAGNIPRQTAAEMLAAILPLENPKFHVRVVEVPWNAYGAVWHGGPGGHATGPMYIVGWLADYPDVDDWVVPFLQSTGGTFSYPQHIDMDPNSGLIDNYIKNGAYNATVAGRDYNYQKLWQLYHQEAVSLPLQNAFGRRFARDWVHGWYYNSIYPGVYAYTQWKEDISASTGPFAGKHGNWEDITEDGKVDIKDLATAALAYGGYFIQSTLPPFPVGPAGYSTPNWDSRGDLNIVNPSGGRADMKVDIKDLAQMATLYGFQGDPWVAGP